MRKVLAAVFWIVLLNVAFTGMYVVFTIDFNPTITYAESYEYGQTYGASFFLLSVVLIVYLATSNRLPGARPRH
jgi:hypothetical protein